MPTPLTEIDPQALPAGTSKIRLLGDTIFYRATWLLAVRDGEIYYVSDGKADEQIGTLFSIEDQVKQLESRIAALKTEEQRLAETLLPPAKPRKTKAKGADRSRELLVCNVDGCTDEKGSGKALQMHRVRRHPEWTAWQMALEATHPLKVALGGPISLTAGRRDNYDLSLAPKAFQAIPIANSGDDCAKEAAGAVQDGPFDAIAQAPPSVASAE